MTELREIIKNAAKEAFDIDIEPELTRPEEQFGDYSTNVAMQLVGKLANPPAGGPREIADQLVAQFKSLSIAKTEVAGPGFINFWLTDQALAGLLDAKPTQKLTGKKTIVEYSDPNPLKPLHAGHLYTTIVGESIANLLKQVGSEVIRINYGGDVGLHVGKSMWAIIQNLGGELPEKLNQVHAADRPKWLGERYVEGNNAYEDDEAKREQIIDVNKRVYQLHEQNDHDSAFAKIYWTTRDWSYKYFEELYKELKVHHFDRVIPESEITALGMQIVKNQLSKGVYKESNGAVIFEGEKYGLHTRVFITSNGLPTYEAKDVGLLLTKWQDYHFDRSIVITANEQKDYMEVMLKSVELFEPEPAKRSMHLIHGIVKLAGGVKMSSRKGNIVGALDILEAADEASKKQYEKFDRNITLGAVKYAFLKHRIGADIIFDPVESVSLQGNSGPYLQYALVRAKSILQKSKVARSTSSGPESQKSKVEEFEAGERSLARKISEYPETVEKAVNELMPHHVATYLYELAQTFNRFYETNRVVGDPREAIRLKLVQSYANVLKNGLELLNIPAPEKM